MKSANQPAFLEAGCGDDFAAEVPELVERIGRAGNCAVRHTWSHRVEETVALPDETIEIRQRAYLIGTSRPIIGDGGQPEPELGETHRGGILIYPEEILLQDPSLLLSQESRLGRQG